MYNKIEEYVIFKLRNDSSKDKDEKKEEILSNIIDRYDALCEKTNDQEYSYIEAIKAYGEFTNEDKEAESYKPEIAEMLLVSATILSVTSLIVTLLSGVAGVIVLGVSITLYSVGTVYLFQFSKFVQSEEYDIEKYNLFIDKTFSYMKTNFIFWSIALSLIFARMIYSLVLLIVLTTTIDTWNIEYFRVLLFLAVVGFFIVFAIIGSLFIVLYRKIMIKYADLTGKNDVKSVWVKAKEFISNEYIPKKNIFLRKWFYPLLNFIIIIILFIDIRFVNINRSDWDRFNNFFITENFIIISLYILITILFLKEKIKNHLLLPGFTLVISLVGFIIWIVIISSNSVNSQNGPLLLYIGIIFSILFIFDFVLNRKIK
ncbi:MAG: hypothetical protein QM489_04800 [Candidatus Izemoplasma sp.]